MSKVLKKYKVKVTPRDREQLVVSQQAKQLRMIAGVIVAGVRVGDIG
jgi:hypothetical protein